MPGLFSMLSAAARALEAQRFGLDVTGQNVANVNTPGYARRVVDLAAVPPVDRVSAGGGVEVLGTRALRDRMYDRQLWTELPGEHLQQSVADGLGVVEIALGPPDDGLDKDLAALFDAFARLADTPTSATARHEVIASAEGLVSAFRDTAGRLSAARRDADVRIRGAVADINQLVTRIAELNDAISAIGLTGRSLSLQDEQREAVKTLAAIVDVQTIDRADGGVDVSFARGRPLVVGEHAYQVSVTSTPPSGFATVLSEGIDVTATIAGGRLGGDVQVRDTLIPAYATRLDTLAYTLATEVNALHGTGFDLNGTAGGAFFQPPGGVAGAASSLSVDNALAGDPGLVAAAGVASPGDNQVARALADLRDARVLGGGTTTLLQGWAELVFVVGTDGSAAQAAARSSGEVVQQIETLRDGVSGISLDEEAAMMMRFQRAYEANARFFTVIDESLQVLLGLGR